MGNSIQTKKKVQTEANSSAHSLASPRQVKTKGSWLLGRRRAKVKTAGLKGGEDQKRLVVHYTASQHYQENVFTEGSRPQYLEDLHTEAQEGLKILQQEEHKNGLNCPDDDSSTDTLCPEQDMGSKDRVCSVESRSVTGNTEITTASARAVLTRQGSTFKPLNSVKNSDKSKRRNRRTTIMGIPNQVQKELALHRSFQKAASTRHHDPDEARMNSHSGVVMTATEGEKPVTKMAGARVHLSELEATKDEQLLRKHLGEMHQEEPSLDQRGFGSHYNHLNPRPKSLAVAGMSSSSSLSTSMLFSFLREPQGPVMSISPQAAYLSTIIPNAVLPASVEVIEIDRRSNQTYGNSTKHGRSVCTVSKSSLTSTDSSVSPLLSRRSEAEGSQTDNSLDSTTSISGSNWSKTRSSKTPFSSCSPLSPGITPGDNSLKEQQNGQEDQRDQNPGVQELVTVASSPSTVSSDSSEGTNVTDQGSESGLSGSAAAAEDEKNKLSFARSLSVIKTKQPPAPPRRTNSLHKIRCNGRILGESTMVNGAVSEEVEKELHRVGAKDQIETVSKSGISIPTKANGFSLVDVSSGLVSPTTSSCNEGGGASPSTNSSPQKTLPEEGKFERTISPSSGYSSQSATPTLSPKGIPPASPDKHKKKPLKPERSVSRTSSSAASPSSSLTSLSSSTSEPINQDVSKCSPGLPPKGLQQTAAASASSENTVSPTLTDVRELLDIPPPPKVKAPCAPPPEVWTHNRRCFDLLCGPSPNPGTAPQKPAKPLDTAVKQAETQTENNEETHVADDQPAPADTCVSSPLTELNTLRPTTQGFHKELEKRRFPADPEIFPKKGPPPVMKKPNIVWRREGVISTELSAEEEGVSKGGAAGVRFPTDSQATSSQAGMTVPVDSSQNGMDNSEAASHQMLPAQVTPPPAPPPGNKSPSPPPALIPLPSASAPPGELPDIQDDIHVADSSWPPPPPPLEAESVFEGGDEVDLPPPPPPPVMSDKEANMTDFTILDLNGSLEATECCIWSLNEDERCIHEHIPDLPAVVPERTAGARPQDVLTCSKGDAENEISPRCPQNMSVPDRDAPPAVDFTPVTKPENPASVSISVPPYVDPDSKDNEKHTPSESPVSSPILVTVPIAPPLPAENLTQGVTFRRQPSVTNRDTRSKELLSRHKSAPIPKEDANIPLVTPSLLQMVRLRSVSTSEEQIKAPSEDESTIQGDAATENNPGAIPGPQSTPQKPIRKSLSLKSPQLSGKTPTVTPNAPSMRLQEAIRIKTAAMSSRDGLPSLLGVRSSTQGSSGEQGARSLRLPEGYDLHKSPASTASFIFSRSTKKVVIETAATSSPEAQANLKQSLAAELMQLSDQSKVISNGRLRTDKVPPPVARKPSHGAIGSSPTHLACSAKDHEKDGVIQPLTAMTSPQTTTTRVTADTIETLF